MRGSRVSLFDAIDRTDGSPAGHLETSFQFLNRVAGTFWAQVRELMQSWLDHVDEDIHYNDLRGRLRDEDRASFSAFLELYLHEFFKAGGYDVTIHPDLPGTARRPDFLVEGHELSFYVEATMPGTAATAQGLSRRRQALLDSIQKCRNQDFFLALQRLVVGPTPAAGKKVRLAVERWLATLDPDTATFDNDGRETFSWSADGWDLELAAVPISPANRGRPDHRPIGIYADGEAGIVDDARTIQAALTSKATAYGDLAKPLVVALGTFIWDRDRWHAANALYGREAVTWRPTESGDVQQMLIRLGDGFFGTVDRWKRHNVTAVLHVNQLQPYYLQRAEVTLWPHPTTGKLLDPVLNAVPMEVVRLRDQALVTEPSRVDPSLHFGLDEPWPKGEPFPDNPSV